MAFGSSPAENLIDAWHTKAVAKKVNEDGIKAGHFETFLKGNGFTAVIAALDTILTRHTHTPSPKTGIAQV